MIEVSSLHALTDETEYEAALIAVRLYFDGEPDADTAEASRFDALILQIEDYEARHYPIVRVA